MAETIASTFKAKLLRPEKPGNGALWAFLVLPKATSDTLPRRGRTSVEGTINGHPFHATLDPDGQLSHWLKVDKALQDAAAVSPGDMVAVQVSPATTEPEPPMPDDLQAGVAGFRSNVRRVGNECVGPCRRG